MCTHVSSRKVQDMFKKIFIFWNYCDRYIKESLKLTFSTCLANAFHVLISNHAFSDAVCTGYVTLDHKLPDLMQSSACPL